MKIKILSSFAILFFLTTGLSTANSENPDICYCDLTNYVSDGSCFCDSIIMYHSYLTVTKNREIAIEAAADYLDDCDSGFQ